MFIISFSVNSQEIGDVYEGGYIFQINDDGTGLIASPEDLENYSTNVNDFPFDWYTAVSMINSDYWWHNQMQYSPLYACQKQNQ